jgi:hypothetical protein
MSITVFFDKPMSNRTPCACSRLWREETGEQGSPQTPEAQAKHETTHAKPTRREPYTSVPAEECTEMTRAYDDEALKSIGPGLEPTARGPIRRSGDRDRS